MKMSISVKASTANSWYGNLDDIRLFDYLITPEEVEALTINGGLTPESAESVEDWFNDEAV